jgi:hypothetical protein
MTWRRVPMTRLEIGVMPYGFTAHAWVSHKGLPVNERPDKIKDFLTLSLG